MSYNDNYEKVKQDWFWVQEDSGKWSQMLFQGWGTNNAVSLTEIAVEGGREVHLLPFSFIANLQDIQLCEMPSELKK